MPLSLEPASNAAPERAAWKSSARELGQVTLQLLKQVATRFAYKFPSLRNLIIPNADRQRRLSRLFWRMEEFHARGPLC